MLYNAGMASIYIAKLIKTERRNSKIRALRDSGKTFAQLAKLFNISRARAHKICNGKRNRRGG